MRYKIIILFFFVRLLLTQEYNEIKKIMANDGTSYDYFAYSIDMTNNYALIGSYQDDDDASNSGSAYLYKFNESNKEWNFLKKLTASDADADDDFGYAVAITDSFAFVSALGENSSRGAVYIFAKDEGGIENWGEIKKLSKGASYRLFGKSIDVSDTLLVVGQSRDNQKGNRSGSAYIFAQNNGGTNNWGQVKKINASDGLEDDEFGWAVAIDNNTIAIGCYGDDITGTYSNNNGSVYIFDKDEGGLNNWGERGYIVASERYDNDHFGTSLSFENNYLIVGVPYANSSSSTKASGYAYIYKNKITSFPLQKKLVPSDGISDDQFAYSVAISDGVALVGSRYHDGSGSVRGAAYMYQMNSGGVNNWGEVKTFSASDGADYDHFGFSLSLSNDKAFISSDGDDDNGTNSGSTYFFDVDQFLDIEKISDSDILISDDSSLYTALRFKALSDSIPFHDISFTNIGSSNLTDLKEAIFYLNDTALDTILSTSNQVLHFHLNSDTIRSTDEDSFYLKLRWNSFEKSEDFQFELTRDSIAPLDTVDVYGIFPMISRKLTYEHFYTISSVSSSNPSILPGTESWQGYFLFDKVNQIDSIIIQNRLNSGTNLSADDIDSVFLYINTNSSDPTSGSRNYAAPLNDDGFGGTATINFSSSHLIDLNERFHISYLLSSSLNTSNHISVSIDSVALLNPSSPTLPFPHKFSSDVTLPVRFAPLNYKDLGKKGLEFEIRTLSETSLSTIRFYRYTLGTGEKRLIAEFENSGSTSQGKLYLVKDTEAKYKTKYLYQLYENDIPVSPSLEINRIPKSFSIGRSYPNPFNPSSTIDIILAEKSDIQYQIYNLLGQIVYTKIIKNADIGVTSLTWDARNNFSRSVASGIYFVHVHVKSKNSKRTYHSQQKLILLK